MFGNKLRLRCLCAGFVLLATPVLAGCLGAGGSTPTACDGGDAVAYLAFQDTHRTASLQDPGSQDTVVPNGSYDAPKHAHAGVTMHGSPAACRSLVELHDASPSGYRLVARSSAAGFTLQDGCAALQVAPLAGHGDGAVGLTPMNGTTLEAVNPQAGGQFQPVDHYDALGATETMLRLNGTGCGWTDATLWNQGLVNASWASS